MINSELREYCTDIISYFSDEYPYYFMHTDTSTNNNYWQQYGATIYLSRKQPTVNSQFSMYSDEWLCITVYSSNASNNDHTERLYKTYKTGNVSCSEWEFVYSNIDSTFAYASVDVHNNVPVKNTDSVNSWISIFMCACLFSAVVALWLRR